MDACPIISTSSLVFVTPMFPWHLTPFMEADGRIWTFNMHLEDRLLLSWQVQLVVFWWW